MLFSEAIMKIEDLPKNDPDGKGKTPGQRLRAILFILWTQNGSKDDFEVYYKNKMEILIEKLKEQIED